MLTFEIMGPLCLAIFWVAVVLVAADAWLEIRDLRRLGRAARRVRKGTVLRGDGPEGAFATVAFEQRAHALDGAEAIDVSHGIIEDALHGGALRWDDEAQDGDPAEFAADEGVAVWLDEEAFAAGAEAPDDFAACLAKSATPKGYRRPLTLTVGVGDVVFASDELVTTFDPQPFLGRRVARLGLFLVLHVLTAALATAVALYGVSQVGDGLLTQVGAALCLAHFLASPPILRATRAATRTPTETRRFWTWRPA